MPACMQELDTFFFGGGAGSDAPSVSDYYSHCSAGKATLDRSNSRVRAHDVHALKHVHSPEMLPPPPPTLHEPTTMRACLCRWLAPSRCPALASIKAGLGAPPHAATTIITVRACMHQSQHCAGCMRTRPARQARGHVGVRCAAKALPPCAAKCTARHYALLALHALRGSQAGMHTDGSMPALTLHARATWLRRTGWAQAAMDGARAQIGDAVDT